VLRWGVGELDVAGCRDNVQQWLLPHAAFASAAGTAMFLLPSLESPPEVWRSIVCLFAIPAGIFLWRTWKAMPDPPPSR
jgi:hypothetical protein